MQSRDSLNRRAFLHTVGIGSAALVGGCREEVPSTPAQTPAPPQLPLTILQDDPYNAEPTLSGLANEWITPTERFYIRNHAPTPSLDPSSFRLKVHGMVREALDLSLGDLQEQFERVQLTATLTCAGNRRNEHSKVKQVSGVPWGKGAIGNARWGGFRLSDVLNAAGLRKGASHVWFRGLDEIPRGQQSIPFGASIPLQRALADNDVAPGALLAVEMNGVPLEPNHGFPLRGFVPGYIGARSVKWLGEIVVSDAPSTNHYVSRAYKIVPDDAKETWDAASPIYEFPINSAICVPADGAEVPGGGLEVAGYALAPGSLGTSIERVEVSADEGSTWTLAEWTSRAESFCWQLWRARIQVGPATSTITVRATDSNGRQQPQTVEWNMKGYLFNAWERIPLRVG